MTDPKAMKELVAVNPDTGTHENHGLIAARRKIGTADVWLTYSEDSRMWWIVIKQAHGGLSKMGFAIDRREECWQMFKELTIASLDQFRDLHARQWHRA